MSVVSSISVFSNNSSAWGINARLAFAMDNFLAVPVGIALRFTLDYVTRQNFRLSCSLIGLWEGVISLHFITKMPSSYDPYIGFAIRLFVDYWLTENAYRLVIVLIWFVVGMALADIAPGVWKDTGLHRVWRQFRRDLYIMSSKVPRVTVFPRARTVRFSPSRVPSVTEDASSLISPSVATPTVASMPAPPATRIIPPTPSPAKRRRVPGSFPLSETDSDLGSVLGLRPPESGFGSSYSRYSAMPRRPSDTISEMSTQSNQDVDDANVSSSDSSSTSTIEEESRNAPDIPDEVQTAPVIEVVEETEPVKEGERNTPRPSHLKLPPTPSDSARAFDIDVAPPTSTMPVIPDNYDGPGFSDDWEKVTKEDAQAVDDVTPPAPPPKDTPDAEEARTEVGEQRTPIPSPSQLLLSPAPQPVPPPIPRASRVESVENNITDNNNNGFPPFSPENTFESTLFPEQRSLGGQAPQFNDLLGWGSDRPPSYTEPFAGGFAIDRGEKSGMGQGSTIAEEPENLNTPTDFLTTPAGNGLSRAPSAEALVYVDDPPPITAPPAETQEQMVPDTPSVASEFIDSVTERLRQAVVLRGQMVQVEGIVSNLKVIKDVGEGWTPEREAELARAEKALGKMVRKAERRYTNALEESSLNSPPAELDLGAVVAPKVEQKIEEAIELHLRPDAKSLKFSIVVGKAKAGRTQKPIVIQTLEAYNLPYTFTAAARAYDVDLPESQYAEWLEKNRRTDSDD